MKHNATVVQELNGNKQNVFALWLRLLTPFICTWTAYIRGFLRLKIRSFKLSFLRFLRDYKRSIKSRLCRHLTTCTMREQPSANIGQFKMVVTQRVMAFFASCEQFRYSKRFDCWNGNIMYLNALHGRWL